MIERVLRVVLLVALVASALAGGTPAQSGGPTPPMRRKLEITPQPRPNLPAVAPARGSTAGSPPPGGVMGSGGGGPRRGA